MSDEDQPVVTENARTEAGVCPACYGIGRIVAKQARPGRAGEPVSYDIVVVDWSPCRLCAGSGIYVSRARAGLRDADPT